jgi:hypothetical protein
MIALRCHVEHLTSRPNAMYLTDNGIPKANSGLVLVFDSETSIDEAQSLLFGSCHMYVYGYLKEKYLFYADNLEQCKVAIIAGYAKEHGYTLLSRKELVESIFIPYAFKARAKVVGFHLPFDLTRLSIKTTRSTKYSHGFSLILSEDKRIPRIVIKSLNNKASFIEFTNPERKKSEQKYRHYKGNFIDSRTATFALTDKSFTLEGAAKEFDCKLYKLTPEGHGKIAPEYIAYNNNDTCVTYELYTKVLERYQLYCLDKDLGQLYSPASIGKANLEKIGVRSFFEKNPDFSKHVMGKILSAYF